MGLPSKQSYAKIRAPHELNLKAIAVYVATGFFFETDTFYKDEVCLLPAHDHTFDDEGYLLESKPWFEWFYSPRELSFQEALDEYQSLLNTPTTQNNTPETKNNHRNCTPINTLNPNTTSTQ